MIIPNRELPEIDYEKVNPGVRQLVKLLRTYGFDTSDSGDGATHDHECDRPFAYVSIRVKPSDLVIDADALKLLMELHGVKILPISMEDTPYIQATYDPANPLGILDLCGVSDKMLSMKK